MASFFNRSDYLHQPTYSPSTSSSSSSEFEVEVIYDSNDSDDSELIHFYAQKSPEDITPCTQLSSTLSEPPCPSPSSGQLERLSFFERLKSHCKGKGEVFDLDLLSNKLSDIPRPEHVTSVLLVAMAEHSPLLLAVVKTSCMEEKEPGPQPSSSKPENNHDKEALVYIRRLAWSLHAALQNSCPYPMCILSLVISLQEKDPGKMIGDAVSQASKVVPYSRLVMTPAKYTSILTAVEQKIGKEQPVSSKRQAEDAPVAAGSPSPCKKPKRR